jgi:type VI protein secretion system component VasK
MASSKSSRDDVRRLILLILAGYTVLAIGFLQWYFTRNGQHPVWVLILGAAPTVALVVYGIRYLRARRASAQRPE